MRSPPRSFQQPFKKIHRLSSPLIFLLGVCSVLFMPCIASQDDRPLEGYRYSHGLHVCAASSHAPLRVHGCQAPYDAHQVSSWIAVAILHAAFWLVVWPMSDGELVSVVLAAVWQGGFCFAVASALFCTFADIRDPLCNNQPAGGGEHRCQWCKCASACLSRLMTSSRSAAATSQRSQSTAAYATDACTTSITTAYG